MMRVSGVDCPGCGDATLADEIDRYPARDGRWTLKLRCTACGGLFLTDFPDGTG